MNLPKNIKQGFTLVELLVVIAIIAIIAAIAIPNLMRARISANEASAVGTLRNLVSSQVQFKTAGISVSNLIAQDGNLTELGAADPPLLDQVLGAAILL